MGFNEVKVVSTVSRYEIESFTCDICSKTYAADNDVEMQELLDVSFIGGWGSVFGDGRGMRGVFCQHCVKDVLGKYLKEVAHYG